jgi:protein gp37
MAQNSRIEWTNHTANLWWGCTKVHAGCDNCYAEALSNRFGCNVWGNDAPRKLVKSVWNDLDKYQRLAKENNEIHRVFVGSMMDIFEKPMPLIDNNGSKVYDDEDADIPLDTNDLRNLLFGRISNNRYPNLMFLLLTKRPSNINKYIPESWKVEPPSNVMFGTSPVNQETANTLIKQLATVKGKRFISLEPQLDYVNLLEPLVINNVGTTFGRLIDWVDWVIQGGESGHHKRPFNIEWAYDMQRQCDEANTPFFFKQIDKVQEIPADLNIKKFPIF